MSNLAQVASGLRMMCTFRFLAKKGQNSKKLATTSPHATSETNNSRNAEIGKTQSMV